MSSKLLKFLFSLVIFAALCYVGLVWFVNSEVTKELNRAVEGTPGLDLAYDDLDVDIREHTVSLHSVDATFPSGHHVTADTLNIIKFDQLNAVPHYATLSASGLTIPVTLENFGTMAAAMKNFGIETLHGTGKLDYRFDPVAQSLTLNSLSLDDHKLGVIDINATISGFDLTNPKLEKLIGLHIKDADIRFKNRELMNMMIAGWARMMHATEGKTVETISTELNALAAFAAKQDNGPAENVMLGLERFINDPQTMTMTARPEHPVPVLYFFMGRDIFDNLDLLNMSITTTKNLDMDSENNNGAEQ